MKLDFDDREKAFRREVRDFLKVSLPNDIYRKMMRAAHAEKADIVRWQRILNKKGWAVPHWPQQWGGTGWTPVQRYIFAEEITQWPAPEPLSFNTTMVGPVISTFGSEEQRKRFLPSIANLDIWFCQGFSEPGAGSDLASLSTWAERRGDHYIINGQKIWTSTAHHADWIFLLVRTSRSAKKQQGISFILVDLRTPGVDIRPILTIDGQHHTNEVFFTDVRVPVANLVGEENRGWEYAKFLLGNERAGIARVGLSKARLREAKALAVRQLTRSGSLWDDPEFRREFVRLEVELKSIEITAMRLLTANVEGKPDPMSSILKIKGAETQQRAAELMFKAAGPHTIPAKWEKCSEPIVSVETLNDWAEGKAPTYFFSRAASIYGGSNEIQRNILAKVVLEL
ncbi:acyl-CoA dehydrogenase family protein [Bradyrhizobium sp. 195]|uniref:acyl-CoA dehydrogenase family protein n=1 Tax=Bradyrhizobium sp. 195 TaxID=2782662 RepID=UPI00200135A3|nr:acyl-CoA dehydrogenase family protein [Bradyrhizobium sp. 195]UPK29948.1 acyl-CoA dehydrogenase family protein [Bradyrhizobium sp. 195]